MTAQSRDVLLLGGTGFIGAPLSQRLRGQGYTVSTASRAAHADIRIDATDESAVAALLTEQPFDVVINLMGSGLATATADPTTLASINTRLPGLILSTLLAHHPRTRLIHAASSTERASDDEPDESEYSRTKHEGAEALRSLAKRAAEPVTLVRIHNTYGPGQPETRFVANTIAQLARGDVVRLNYPTRVRDFVLIDDVVDSFAAIVGRPAPGLSTVELGTGVGTTLMDVAREISELLPDGVCRIEPVLPLLDDPHPYAVARAHGGDLGTCVTTLSEGLARTIGDRQ